MKLKPSASENESLYKVFINSTKDMVFLKDENFNYQIINKALADFFGKEEHQIIGKSDFQLMSETAARRCQSTDNDAMNSKAIVVSEERISTRIYETQKFKVQLSNGKFGIGGFIRDVTEQKEVAEQMTRQSEKLRELNATKDKFFSIIAHDLKGPFNSILGFSELLIENYRDLDGDSVRKSLQAISGAARQAYTLLENLLLWSKTQTGRIEFKPEMIYLNERIQDIIRLLKIQSNKKNIQISSSIPRQLCMEADRNMLDTILRNLLSNAIKFTPRNGKIVTNAILHDDCVEISITDNGIGISKEDLEKIFRIDSKTSTPGTEKEKGSGIGLILCREFIQRQGGRIWAISEQGKGSTFTFSLPVSLKK